MRKIDIVIVEDNKEEMELLEQSLITHDFNIIDKVDNLEDGIRSINTKSFDLIIIDIYLEGKPSGLRLAEEVNKKFQFQKPFLFLTGSSEREIFEQAKNSGPHSYLLKPFNELELLYAIELSIEKYTKNSQQEIEHIPKSCFPMLIKKQATFYKIEKEDILFLEVDGRYCNIVTLESNFLIQSTLNDFQKQLPESDFIRTHRGFIVNLDAIKKVHLNENHIIVKGGKGIPLGRAYKADFLKRYNIIK
ncbi:MAG: LytTR family DNA-binding domain-containing protein [Bacteroidota bacterium]